MIGDESTSLLEQLHSVSLIYLLIVRKTASCLLNVRSCLIESERQSTKLCCDLRGHISITRTCLIKRLIQCKQASTAQQEERSHVRRQHFHFETLRQATHRLCTGSEQNM